MGSDATEDAAPKRGRLILADDDTLVLEGLQKLLVPEFDVVALIGDGRALLSAARKLLPDAILLDVSMPGLNGIEAARQLTRALPQIKLIFLTMHVDETYAEEAFRAGAAGYVVKRSAGSELVFAIREVLAGRQYVTPQITRDLLQHFLERASDQPAKPELTPRQREVIQLIAEGRSNKEIANTLNTSVKTVEFHKSQIMKLLNLHTTAELTRYAIKHGIVGL